MAQSSGETERNRRIREAALKDFRQRHAPEIREHELVLRAKTMSKNVFNLCGEVLKSPKAGGYDKLAMKNLIDKLFIDGFAKWSKDELLFLIVLMHSEQLSETMDGEVAMGLTGPDRDKPI